MRPIEFLDFLPVRYLGEVAGVMAEFRGNFLTFLTGNSEYGERVHAFPQAIIVEIPNRRVSILWLVGGVVGFVEYECADWVAARRDKIGLGAFDTEPGRKSDEVVVGRGKVGSTGNVLGNEVVLLRVACRVAANLRNVKKALDHAIKCVGVGSCEGGDIRFESLLVCYLTREGGDVSDDSCRYGAATAPNRIAEEEYDISNLGERHASNIVNH